MKVDSLRWNLVVITIPVNLYSKIHYCLLTTSLEKIAKSWITDKDSEDLKISMEIAYGKSISNKLVELSKRKASIPLWFTK